MLALSAGAPRGAEAVALVFVLLALNQMSALVMTYWVDTKVEAKAVASSRDSKLAPYASSAGINEMTARLETARKKFQMAEAEIRKIDALCLKTPREWREEQKKLPASDPKRAAVPQDIAKLEGACREAKAKIAKEHRPAKDELAKAQQRIQALKKGPVNKP
jgi:peptidoglycan hydrolase CwlO-like protein